jgi:flavorubredoxin
MWNKLFLRLESLKYLVDVYKVCENEKKKRLFNVHIIVQERLTRQIAEAIAEAIEPRGVAVIVECLLVIENNEKIKQISIFLLFSLDICV